jgi:hypothetical protein
VNASPRKDEEVYALLDTAGVGVITWQQFSDWCTDNEDRELQYQKDCLTMTKLDVVMQDETKLGL